MAKRQREWARKARLALCIRLGGICVVCGSTDRLTIEHKEPRNWSLRKYDPSGRVSRYHQEEKEGKLTVLCYTCNSGKRKMYENNKGTETNSGQTGGYSYHKECFGVDRVSLGVG